MEKKFLNNFKLNVFASTILITIVLILSSTISASILPTITVKTNNAKQISPTRTIPYEKSSRTITNNPYMGSGTPGIPIFIEDFEDGVIPPPGCTHIITNADYTWEIDDYDPYKGNYYASCFYDQDLHSQDEWIVTPSLDFSGYNSGIYLSFWWMMSYYWAVSPNDNYDLNVKISLNGGTTWTLLWNEDTIGSFESWTWFDTTFDIPIDLSAYAGKTNVMIGFQYEGTEGAQLSLDYIQIYASAAHDVGVTTINNPTGTTTATGIITPSITVKNFGVNNEMNVPVNLRIGKKFIAGGTEDFEADNGSYTHSLGPGEEGYNDDWEWGVPDYSQGPDFSYSGSNCWATNLDGTHSTYGDMVLDSVEFNLSGLDSPRLEFYHWYDFYYYRNGGNVKISTNSGETWAIIRPFGGYPEDHIYTLNKGIPREPAYSNRYVSGDPYGGIGSDGWELAKFDLSDYIDETITIRWHCGTYTSASYNRAGWYIDDVKIAYGELTEEHNETLYVEVLSGENREITFSDWTPADWQTAENKNIEYEIIAYTMLVTDEVPSNDYTTDQSILHYPFFDDVGIVNINSPVGTTTAGIISPLITVANFGQNNQYDVPVELQINKIHYTYYLKEDFESGLPSDWTVIDGGNSNDTWTDTNPGERVPEGGCDETFLIADSDHAGFEGVFMDEWLITPSFSLNYDWPMHRNNALHTGYSKSSAPYTNNTIWNQSIGWKPESSPAVYNGNVYIGSKENKVFCFDAGTGDPIWNYTTLGTIGYSSPAIYDGYIYIGDVSRMIYCLDAYGNGDGTTTEIWNYTTGSFVYSSPTVVDGYVYIGSHDGKIYCLDAKGNETTGTTDLIWSYQTDEIVTSSPAVANGRVYVGSYDGKLYCLNASDGSYIWNYTTQGPISYSSPAIVDDKVYIGSWDYNVYCINATDGSFIWSHATGEKILSSPAVSYGYVYVGSYDNKVYCLDAEGNGDGTTNLIWEYETGSRVFSSPAVADDKVYVGSRDGVLYCLDAYNGNLIWHYVTYGVYPPVGGIGSSPAIANGTVYVASTDGKLYAFKDTTNVFLNFGQYYNHLTSDFAEIDVSNDGGNNWTNIAIYTEDIWGPTSLNISDVATGKKDVKIRFHFNDFSTWAWYWMIDNIEVCNVIWLEEYNHTIYVDLLAGEIKDVTFPDWTPADIARSSTEFDYDVRVCTKLNETGTIDKDTGNDYNSELITLLYVDDVAVESITRPTPPRPLVEVFSESFEETWITDSDGDLAPPLWENHITDFTDTGDPNYLPHFWGQYGTVPSYNPPAVPHDGNDQAMVQWSYNHQDEWLITPIIDLSRYENCQLSFWRYGVTGSTHGDHYYVKVSPTGGFDKTDFTDILWDASTLPEGDNHYDEPYMIDLSAYDGTSIRIAWHNNDPPNNDGLWYGSCIDDIDLEGEINGAYPPDTYNIEAIVKNHGTYYEDFNANAKIFRITNSSDDLVYESDCSIINLASHDEETAIFDDWTVTDFGVYRLEIRTNLAHDENTDNDLKIKILRVDTEPPITVHSLDSIIGENQWHISDVEITLTATDDISGVKKTYYKIDSGDWHTYSNPFVISADGVYTVSYYSVDNAVNIEDEKSTTFKIDQTPPTITLLNQRIGLNKLKFIADVNDPTSGIDRVEFYLDDEPGYYTVEDEPYEWIWTGTGDHTITAIVYNMAGNQANSTSSTPHSQDQSNTQAQDNIIPKRKMMEGT